jgi:hypothetical protein
MADASKAPPKVPLSPPPPPPAGGRRKTAWMKHVAATMKSEKSKKGSMGKGWFKHVLKTAKASYKKKGGSLSPLSPASVGGTRRRRRRGGK